MSTPITQQQRQDWLMREDTWLERFEELHKPGDVWRAWSGRRFIINGQRWENYGFEARTKWDAIDAAIIAENSQ